MRLFVAISAEKLSFDPKLSFKKIRVSLDHKEVEYRWVPVENYHITLNFLGEIDPAILDQLKLTLESVAKEHKPFTLNIERMGAFPDERSGRVIWVGAQNSKQLRSLQSHCENALTEIGLELEQCEYRPHLTVARLRSPRKLTDVLSPLKKQSFGKLSVELMTLYESKLGGSIPIYEPVEHYHLGNFE